MWVEKSSDENEKDLKKEAVFGAVLFSLFVFALLIVSAKLGFNKWKNPAINPIPWNEVPSHLPFILGICLIVFIAAYFGQKANNRRVRAKAFVCLGCGEKCSTDCPSMCPCGGRCVDLNHAKWIKSNGIQERAS